MKYMIGQRVLIYNSVIGTVVTPENPAVTNGVWKLLIQLRPAGCCVWSRGDYEQERNSAKNG